MQSSETIGSLLDVHNAPKGGDECTDWAHVEQACGGVLGLLDSQTAQRPGTTDTDDAAGTCERTGV